MDLNQPNLHSLLPPRRIDDDMGRTHELEHSAIKTMRGVLYCYMRQADKVSSGVRGQGSEVRGQDCTAT